jgi:hypothetical protein
MDVEIRSFHSYKKSISEAQCETFDAIIEAHCWLCFTLEKWTVMDSQAMLRNFRPSNKLWWGGLYKVYESGGNQQTSKFNLILMM